MAATQDSIATTVQVTGVTPSDRTGIGYTPGTGGPSTGDSLNNALSALQQQRGGGEENQQQRNEQQNSSNNNLLEGSPHLRPTTGATPLHPSVLNGGGGRSDGPIRQPAGINDSPHAKDQHSQQIADAAAAATAAKQQQQQTATTTTTSAPALAAPSSKYVPKRNSNAPQTATNSKSTENKDSSSDDVEVVGESRPTNPHAATAGGNQSSSNPPAGSGKQAAAAVGRGSSSNVTTHQHQDTQSAMPNNNNNKKKEKVQTKFTWGLQKDREPELLQQIEDLKKQVAEKDKIIFDMSEKQTTLEAEIAKLQRQCKEQSEDRSDEEDRMQRLQTALRETMLKTAQAHRRDARRAQHDNHFELGQVVTTQTAVGAQEMWVYGNRYREILAEIEKNKQRLEDCESAKKDAENVKRTSSKKIGSGPMVIQPPHHVPAVSPLTDNATAEGAAVLGGGFTHNNHAGLAADANTDPAAGGHHQHNAFTHQLPAPEQQGAQISNGFVNPNDLPKNEKGVAINEHLDNYLYAEAQAEIHKLEVSYLKAEIERLQQEKLEIDIKRVSFLKECTRIQEEDRSVFCNTPAIGPTNYAGGNQGGGNDNLLGGGALATLGGAGVVTSTTGNASIKFSQGNRYILIHLLGKGGFSEVWKAFDIIEGRYVACKIHAVDPRWTREVRDNFFRHIHREFHIQRKIVHERVVKLYDVFSVDERALNGGRGHGGSETSISVMEYCSGVDLDTKLKQQGTLKESEARLILKQILAGLAALHAAGVIHYDLKPANILFTSDLGSCHEIKITDFGLSKQVSQEGNAGSNNPQIELTSQGTGTFWYLPPECFNQGKVSIDTSVDIWAVGVIFYQMLYGKKPFANNQSQKEIWHQNLISLQAKQGVDFPDTKNVSAEAKRFIRLCLAENPRDRPSAVVLGSDHYLTKGKRPRQMLEQQSGGNMPPPAPFDERPPVAPNLRHRD